MVIVAIYSNERRGHVVGKGFRRGACVLGVRRCRFSIAHIFFPVEVRECWFARLRPGWIVISERDGKKNRGFAAHLYPSSSEMPIHLRLRTFDVATDDTLFAHSLGP